LDKYWRELLTILRFSWQENSNLWEKKQVLEATNLRKFFRSQCTRSCMCIRRIQRSFHIWRFPRTCRAM